MAVVKLAQDNKFCKMADELLLLSEKKQDGCSDCPEYERCERIWSGLCDKSHCQPLTDEEAAGYYKKLQALCLQA